MLKHCTQYKKIIKTFQKSCETLSKRNYSIKSLNNTKIMLVDNIRKYKPGIIIRNNINISYLRKYCTSNQENYENTKIKCKDNKKKVLVRVTPGVYQESSILGLICLVLLIKYPRQFLELSVAIMIVVIILSTFEGIIKTISELNNKE